MSSLFIKLIRMFNWCLWRTVLGGVFALPDIQVNECLPKACKRVWFAFLALRKICDFAIYSIVLVKYKFHRLCALQWHTKRCKTIGFSRRVNLSAR
jgi:hypothetical protein